MRRGFSSRSGSLTLVGIPLAFVGLLFVVPAFVIVARSFQIPNFSLENYASFMEGPAVRQATVNTFALALQSSLIAAAIGCVLIAGIVMFGPRWKALIIGALLLPFIASELVRIVSWLLLLGPEGPVAGMFAYLGLPDVTLLGGRIGALLGMVHVELPFFALSALPTVLAIDQALGRASTSLGANRIQRFLSVTFPLALPGVVAPTDLYHHPVSPFAAAFMGEANLIQVARLDPTVLEHPGSGQRFSAAHRLVPVADGADFAPLLCVRPEAIRLTADQGPENLTGVLTAQVFMGDHWRYNVDVGQQSLIVKDFISGSVQGELGKRVQLVLPRDDMPLFVPA